MALFTNTEILGGLLTALDIERSHLLGLSVGGRIAIDFALEHQQVTSLVLAAPGLGGYCDFEEWRQRMADSQATAVPDTAELLEAGIAGAQGLGHVPNMESPEELNRIVLGFLMSIDS